MGRERLEKGMGKRGGTEGSAVGVPACCCCPSSTRSQLWAWPKYTLWLRLSVDALIGIGMFLGIFMQANVSAKSTRTDSPDACPLARHINNDAAPRYEEVLAKARAVARGESDVEPH